MDKHNKDATGKKFQPGDRVIVERYEHDISAGLEGKLNGRTGTVVDEDKEPFFLLVRLDDSTIATPFHALGETWNADGWIIANL